MTAKSLHLSDPGLIRKNNEDSIFADGALGIYLLADGMGGHNAGEVASELAVKTAYAYLAERMQSASDNALLTVMAESLLSAHEAINAKARTDMSLMGMGTTLVAMVVRNNKAIICHVGDSRAYHYRGALQQITRDHTMGDYLLDNKILPREQIPEKQWHTLTQAIGVGDPPVPDLKQMELVSGDILLLCSDGLTDMLSDEEIEAVIKDGNSDLDSIVIALVAAAKAHGGRDNISVVLVKV